MVSVAAYVQVVRCGLLTKNGALCEVLLIGVAVDVAFGTADVFATNSFVCSRYTPHVVSGVLRCTACNV